MIGKKIEVMAESRIESRVSFIIVSSCRGDGGSAIVGTRSIYLKLYNAKTIHLFIQLVSL